MGESLASLECLRQSLDGDEDGARQTLRGLATVTIQNADYHIAVARWADDLLLPDIALREWGLALRDRPDDLAVASALCEALLDAGKLEKAVRCLRTITKLSPADPKAWDTLIEVQRQLGLLAEAEDSRRRALTLTDDCRFKAKLGAEDELLGGDSLEPDDGLDDILVTIFLERFQGREGVYARQWVDPAGNTGYSPIREPLTPRVVKNHLLGNHTLGIYPLRMDNTVLFAAFDLDLAPAVVRACAPGSAGWEEAIAGLEAYGRELLGRAKEMGLRLHPADSGYKGLHLWAFFSQPVPAKQARQMCKVIAAGVTVPPVVRCEIFPKQSVLPPDGLGNLIKVPLGVHRKTGRRVWFRDARPEWTEQKTFLQLAAPISRDQLSQCQDVIVQRELAAFDQSLCERDEAPASLSVPAEAESYHPESDAELQILLSRCVTLRSLVAKIDLTGQLGHNEMRVLIHTIGHIATGPAAVNSFLGRCLETDSSLYLKRPLRGNPMSCASIRAKIPDVTASLPCDCTFAQRGGLYPTPALHLVQASATLPLEHHQFQALLADYLRARKEISRWSMLLQGFTMKLNLWFEETGADELQTSYGTLRRRVDQGGEIAFELSV